MRTLIVAAAATLAVLGAPAPAQEPANGHFEQGVWVPDGSTLAEVQQQQAANKAMADFAKQQVADNAARLSRHAQAQAAYEAELARADAERKARDAAAATTAAEHEAAVAKWRAGLTACNDGDESKCPATAQDEKRGLLRRLLPF